MKLMIKVSFIFDIHLPNPKVFCKLFEYNQSCIYVAESKTFPPRAKHRAIKYHHLRSFVQKKIIQICYIYKEKYLNSELKGETFDFTQGSLIIKRTT